MRWRGWSLTGRYQYKLIDLFDVTPGIYISRFDTDVRLSLLSAVLTRDRRNDILNPTGGYFATIITQYSPGWLGSQAGYLKGQFQLFRYQRALPGMTLATGFRLGLAVPFVGTEDLPISERFFAGGSTSMRAFELDSVGPYEIIDVINDQGEFEERRIPIGGDALLVGNLELRFPLFPGIGGVVFYDVGNVYPRISDMDFTDLTHSLGLGLRYQTPLGPLRIDYGKSLTTSDQNLFFSVGHAF